MRRIVWLSLAFVVMAAVGACSSSPTVNYNECIPDSYFPDPWCPDGGVDAAGPADADTNDANNASSKPFCAGRCAPAPSGDHAGTYRLDPISVWVGPKAIMPKCCPGEEGCDTPGAVPSRLYRVYKDLVAPPASCEPCECGASEGECTALPESIEIRAGTCAQSGVSSLPFDGPAGWDGSCSSDGALPAGAMCNGVPCAQSVWASPLPGPTSDVCTPKKATPSATIKPAEWEIGALACSGKPRDESCGDAGDEKCYEDPGPGWWQCVYHDGVYDFCPDNYWKTPIVMYPEDAIIDERGCEACNCGQPVGSGCLSSIPIYTDAACTSQLAAAAVSSFNQGCVNVPPGIALGAKAVENLGYMPGTCAASGGLPTGAAKANVVLPNVEGKPGPVTFCCTSSFNPIE